MYKYVYYSDLDASTSIQTLRKKFNTQHKNYYFKDGLYKNKQCIFVLNDLTTKVYSDPIESKQYRGSLFFPPLDPIKVEDFEVNPDKKEWKIKVDLVSGTTIYVIPATLEPKKIVFDFDDTETQTEDSPYSLATEYGTLAYSLFEDSQNKKELVLKDPRIKKLIMLGLQKSYAMPIDLINWLGLISEQDIDPLFAACMGYSPELLKKKEDGSEA
jgi:hypothetical protein